jgi:hypothetical protein
MLLYGGRPGNMTPSANALGGAMNRLGKGICIMTLACGGAGSAAWAGGVDISVAITGAIAPGVYGRVDLTNRPAPPLVYAQPMVVEPPPAQVVVAPIYLHVPPEHARDWRHHCHEYGACQRPVYFIKSAEYEPGYVARDRRWHEEEEHRRHEQEEHRWREHREAEARRDHEEHVDRGEHRGHDAEHHEHGDHDHGDHDHRDDRDDHGH